LHRLGYLSAGPILGVHPDISVNAKILTGGLVPLATTLARKGIFDTFLSDSKADALLHGHSYTAYPVGCAIANKTLDLVEELSKSKSWEDAKAQWEISNPATNMIDAWSFWSPVFVKQVSCNPLVEDVMALGTLLAIKFKGSVQGLLVYSL
jgi:dethiobiotin synthetase/adenosylmethionine--8-amino-7-oxononanoate aminotransferase